MNAKHPVWELLLSALCPLFVWGCPGTPSGPDGVCASENEACASSADCCADLACDDGVCVAESTGPPRPALPAKTIGYELIAIHDPNSDGYNGNCVGCHTDRTNEVALDGVTAAAHSTMLGLFGEGNDRCVRCHGSGPNFLTASAGGLREQVDMADAACAACHGAQPIPGATALYAD